MKKQYEEPIIEIIEFEVEDIITSSLLVGGGGTGEEIGWGDIG